ncbi:MAG: dihydroorotase [Ginsengibacter sp.]
MKVLIKNAIIISSSTTSSPTDILIENGIISMIKAGISVNAEQVIQRPGLHVSAGWMDLFANFYDPGNEYKETLESGSKAAAAGGFTDVMVVPNTTPVVHDKSQVEYIVHKSKDLLVRIHPIGAVTRNVAGAELTEMYDMRNSGALAFSDGTHSLQSSGILLKALEYVKAFNGTIIQVPDDENIGSNGLMNEGIISTQLGLPGKPAISEEIAVARDIELVKYTGSRMHFTGISTKKSLELVEKAKQEGISISCSVTPYHLFFCDEDLHDYDTNLKVNPPLRTRSDMFALREGLLNGMIDFISSHHQPHDWDDKTCEFEYAKNGMIGLESMFGVLRSIGCPVATFVKMQTTNIRQIFDLPAIEIKKGIPARLTLFDPEAEYIFTNEHIHSKSKNTPFTGKKLKGQTFGIINGDQLFLK